MIGRSRSQGRSTPQFLSLLLLAGVCFSATSCKSTTPRQHWWEFWKPKAATTDSVYNPDKEILPPPPGALGAGSGPGSEGLPNNLPPPPTAINPTTLPELEPPRSATSPVSDLQTIFFQYDSSDLSMDAQRLLDANAQWMRNRPNFEISIEGHCDEQGTAEYNMNLGARRAKVVRDYLVSKGVDANHLHTISYGEERPLDPGHSEAAYAKNRRVQFLVY